MNSDKARERAEKSFRKEERAQDGRKAMIEYESQARATREKTARLKELRLAREGRGAIHNSPLNFACTRARCDLKLRHIHKVRQLFGGAALSNATVWKVTVRFN